MKRYWDKVNDEWIWEEDGNGHKEDVEAVVKHEKSSGDDNLVLLLSELSKQSS